MLDLHDPLKRWIFAHHERTGRPQDRIVMFFVVELLRASPPPGELYSRATGERTVFGAKR
jgi:hypothetical protein